LMPTILACVFSNIVNRQNNDKKLCQTSKEDIALIYPEVGSFGTRVKTANVVCVSSSHAGSGKVV
jgi:hypothetical protein